MVASCVCIVSLVLGGASGFVVGYVLGYERRNR